MMMLSRLHSTIAVEITHKLSQHIINHIFGQIISIFKKNQNFKFSSSFFLLSKLNRCKQRASDILTGSKLSTINTENMSYIHKVHVIYI